MTWKSLIGWAVLAVTLVALAWVSCTHASAITLTADSAPAWIQAIGSILAIIAAAWIARQQNVNTRKLEEYKQARADKQKLEIIMALMARSHGLADDFCKAHESQKQEDIDQISPPLMADTHQALMALPVFEIPEWNLALDVLMISRGLASLREGYLDLNPPEDADEFKEKLDAINVLASEIRTISDDSIAICKREIKKRDALVNDR
ncbi:MAG: hypothetical protein WBW32_03880 [Luteibacter sp.]